MSSDRSEVEGGRVRRQYTQTPRSWFKDPPERYYLQEEREQRRGVGGVRGAERVALCFRLVSEGSFRWVAGHACLISIL